MKYTCELQKKLFFILNIFVSVLFLVLIQAELAEAVAVRTNAGFSDNTLARNDDGSTGAIALTFTANFLGSSRTTAFINNNGNITFDASTGAFTPVQLSTAGREETGNFEA